MGFPRILNGRDGLNCKSFIRTAAKVVLPCAIQQKLKRSDPFSDLIRFSQTDALVSYSQEGEDLLLRRLLDLDQRVGTGFYIDVGSHHPSHFSNTLFFYLRGWRGINIDAMPGSMELFRRWRPNDINIEAAISETHQELIYYSFNEPALNGFSKELSETRDNFRHYRLVGRQLIQTQTLSDVLDKFMSESSEIDFLSVDVEGLDYQVLHSNNWAKYRPKFVLAEDFQVEVFGSGGTNSVSGLMMQLGYNIVAKTAHTLIFRDEVSK